MKDLKQTYGVYHRILCRYVREQELGVAGVAEAELAANYGVARKPAISYSNIEIKNHEHSDSKPVWP